MSKDYYQILGVAKGASAEEIKKAYRKLALQYHPDRGGGPELEAKFKEINEAYQILSDSEKKQRYDQFGDAAFRGNNGGQGSSQGFGGFEFSGFDFGGGFGGFGDIFEDLFSQSMSQVQAELQITPAQAVLGDELSIDVGGQRVTFKIPSGIQSGDSFRLAGKGKQMRNGRRGDLILTVKIVMPKNISKEQRELWEKIRESEGKKKHWWS